MELGRLGRPYGVKGWSHVESWTDPPAALLRYRHWVLKGPDGSRRPANRQGVRAQGSGIVARVDILRGLLDRHRDADGEG